MSYQEAITAPIDAMEETGVPYMLVGSLATTFYGMPRATLFPKFVIHPEKQSISAIAGQLGPRFRFDPQVSPEAVAATTRFVAEVVDEPFQIEFFLLSDDEHDRERFARRQRVTLVDRQVFVPTAEDVIITKLRWVGPQRQSKHIDDIRGVIAVQGEKIDWQYVNAWCDRHGTRDLLDEIRRSVTPM